MRKSKLLFVMVCIFICIQFFHVDSNAQIKLATDMFNIESFIEEQMIKGKIPGLSVVIVKGDETIYQEGFGYADLNLNKKVTSETLFEIGSNSKAFTALGVLKLQKDGLININDPITKYISWLNMNYQGKIASITIEEFLHHTSGIPTNTIDKIPVTDDDQDAIEETVKTLVGIELDSKPGDKFQYATINYDVLGLLIEEVSGKKYEDYIEENVLKPMGLYNTYMYKDKADYNNIAKGYKIRFRKPRYYEAPSYSGNKPAGYIISNAKDMAKWLKIQLGILKTSTFDYRLIEESHIPNNRIQPLENGLAYAAGWLINDKDGLEIFHGGSNPNYSSFIVLRPKEEIGVAVLSNIKSYHTSVIAQGIIKLLQGKNNSNEVTDLSQLTDITSIVIIIITVLIICCILYFLFKLIKQIVLKKRSFQCNSKKNIFMIIILSISACAISYLIHCIPYFLFDKISWGFLFVWYPSSVRIALYLVYLCIWLLYITILFNNLFRKNEYKNMSVN